MGLDVCAPKHGFTLLRSEQLPEIDGTAHLLKHEASGAKLAFFQNEDDNKAFSISFKTPPANDTGVFHILEHSVLCGSDKFPVKEPFVNLLKNSMQTFLNAMTFPDKTMYPVASTNEQDLLNLADVYLDAVLNPKIYEKETIFQQEGWHYEVEEGEDGKPAIVCNGVVFNEMKGALSDPDSVLYNELSAALFPDTPYAFESGGKPEAIPSLSYEEFLDTHARHYRLDNSYITLYGNLDPDTFLGFLDERYLSPFANLREDAGAPNELTEQAPLVDTGRSVEMITAPENASMAFGFVAGSVRERKRLVALDILLDALMGSNEAPLKRALLNLGLADEVNGSLADHMLQPFALIQFKGIDPQDADKLRCGLIDAVRKLLEDGIDHELIEAALSHDEFVLRERAFGVADGVAFAMTSLSGWLYDDDLAWAYIRFEDLFAELRADLEGDYFERLLEEVLLSNDHLADIVLAPVEERPESELDRRLAMLTSETDEAGLAAIEATVQKLRTAQEQTDSPDDLAKLPRLTVADIKDPAEEPDYGLLEGQPCACLYHRAPAHGILYAYRYFDLSSIDFDELPYVNLLSLLLKKLPTKRHTAAQLDTMVQSQLGNLSFFSEILDNKLDREKPLLKFTVGSSALANKVESLASIPHEVLTETRFDDFDKIKEVLVQTRVRTEQSFMNNGHSHAMSRTASYFYRAAVAQEALGGVDFYRFLRDLIDNFDERIQGVSEHLEDLAKRLFHDSNCLLSFTGSQEDLERFWAAGASIPSPEGFQAEERMAIPEPVMRNEAFIVPTDITFAGLGYDRRLINPDSSHHGSWAVATRALSYDYLWNEVRVKGGAYGAGAQMGTSGIMRFYSYRDPHLDETVERMRKAGAWLSELDIDQDELDGYIVSTVASIDAPCKPRELVRRQDNRFICNIDKNERMRRRQEVIDTDKAQLNSLGSMVSSISAAGPLCVFGNKEIIEASQTGLEVIDLMA